MNWSVFSASSAAQSQHHKRALLLEHVCWTAKTLCHMNVSRADTAFLTYLVCCLQALIKGSGLLSTSPKSSVAQGHAPDNRSHTSPARLQGSIHFDHDPQGPGKTGDLPKPPAHPNFQHVVRGRSPSPSLRHSPDLDETDEAGPPNPAAANACMHEGLPNSQDKAESGKPTVKVSASTRGNATIPVHQEAEASPLMTNSWQALLALSDNYDR